MNEREKYIGEMLDRNVIRPKQGHLLCEKLSDVPTVSVEGLGEVSGSLSAGGLLVVTKQTEEDAAIRSKLCVVRAMGKDPVEWNNRWFGKERDFKTDWKGQRVDIGSVIGIRAIAGVEQALADKFIEVRYDEIGAIGQPPDDGPDDMLPAPGWVFLDVSLDAGDTKLGSLYFRPEMKDVLENGGISWGRVLALPRDYRDGELVVGDEVCFDRAKNEEYMMLEGSIRAMPQDELLGKRT